MGAIEAEPYISVIKTDYNEFILADRGCVTLVSCDGVPLQVSYKDIKVFIKLGSHIEVFTEIQ